MKEGCRGRHWCKKRVMMPPLHYFDGGNWYLFCVFFWDEGYSFLRVMKDCMKWTGSVP